MSALDNDPHLPNDELSLNPIMVEATDDSYIFAADHVEGLQFFTLHLERFQYAYGWITSWSKSKAFVINPQGIPPPTIPIPSINLLPGHHDDMHWHDVTLKPTKPEFLKTTIDDPKERFAKLKTLILEFEIPLLTGRTPLTVMRKLYTQVLAARLRAFLYLRPITPNDARSLDSILTNKIHQLLGFPYRPSSTIISLPIAEGGFEFPSVYRMNGGIAIEGLLRDLNHHIPSYRTLARITFADWQCRYNGCVSPLGDQGLKSTFNLHGNTKIPHSWLIAHHYLREIGSGLRIYTTDNTHILDGNLSISHVINLTNTLKLANRDGPKRRRTTPAHTHDGKRLNLFVLKRRGIKTINQIGYWAENVNGLSRFTLKYNPISESKIKPLRDNWLRLSYLLSTIRITDLFDEPIDTLNTRDHRKHKAEEYIKLLGRASLIPSIHLRDENENNLWASDGSARPADARIHEDRSVVAATSGPISLALKLHGRGSSILHGEIMGLIMTSILCAHSSTLTNNIILTDHINSVHLIDDAPSTTDATHKLRKMNARSYYKWLLDILARHPTSIKYTRGHSSSKDIQAEANNRADKIATHMHDDDTNFAPLSPIPTFFMDDYTPWTQQDGWIELNIREYAESHLLLNQLAALSTRNVTRHPRYVYDRPNYPNHPYKYALSTFSATVQLYSRSGQLPTAHTISERKRKREDDSIRNDTDKRCRLGCNQLETMHRVFVQCKHFSHWRKQSTQELVTMVSNILSSLQNMESRIINVITRRVSKTFFDDDSLWPLRHSQYYLGRTIPTRKLFDGTGSYPDNKTATQIGNALHYISIRLASRIWGHIQRVVAKRIDGKRQRT